MPVPTTAPAIASVIVAFAAAEPVNRGRLTRVIPSPTVPESSAASSPMVGALGGLVSIVSESAALAALVLPAASVAVAVIA